MAETYAVQFTLDEYATLRDALLCWQHILAPEHPERQKIDRMLERIQPYADVRGREIREVQRG